MNDTIPLAPLDVRKPCDCVGAVCDNLSLAPNQYCQAQDARRPTVELKIKSKEVSGVMKLAIPMTCKRGHRYYREAYSTIECPYCLNSMNQILRHKLQRTKAVLNEIIGSLS